MDNIKSLKKAGITIKRQLSVTEVNKISTTIAEKIYNTFSEHGLIQSSLTNELTKINMYLAVFEDCSAAKYDYKNNSIYFKYDINFDEIEIPAIHECLHFIQTIKNDNGKLKRLGLYEVNKIRNNGMIINEAAVQLMATSAINGENNFDSVKYYGLEFSTESPNYYPIECSLVRQMTYFTGTYPLYHSAIYSDNIFKNTFIMKSSKKVYSKISKNLNLLVKLQENLHDEISYLIEIDDTDSNKTIQTEKDIQIIKDQIRDLTLKTQELILTSCCYSDLKLIRDNQSIREFKNKLYKFQKYLIVSEGYNFYNEFYIKMMEALENKRKLIEEYGTLEVFKEIPENLSLLETRQSKLNLFTVAKQKLIKLFKLDKQEISEKNK